MWYQSSYRAHRAKAGTTRMGPPAQLPVNISISLSKHMLYSTYRKCTCIYKYDILIIHECAKMNRLHMYLYNEQVSSC